MRERAARMQRGRAGRPRGARSRAARASQAPSGGSLDNGEGGGGEAGRGGGRDGAAGGGGFVGVWAPASAGRNARGARNGASGARAPPPEAPCDAVVLDRIHALGVNPMRTQEMAMEGMWWRGLELLWQAASPRDKSDAGAW